MYRTDFLIYIGFSGWPKCGQQESKLRRRFRPNNIRLRCLVQLEKHIHCKPWTWYMNHIYSHEEEDLWFLHGESGKWCTSPTATSRWSTTLNNTHHLTFFLLRLMVTLLLVLYAGGISTSNVWNFGNAAFSCSIFFSMELLRRSLLFEPQTTGCKWNCCK